jgi:threonyl-tRNA synthetase
MLRSLASVAPHVVKLVDASSGDCALPGSGEPEVRRRLCALSKFPYYAKRISLFEQYRRREEERIAAARERNQRIAVQLHDDTTLCEPAVANATTPMDVAKQIDESLAKRALVSKVNGKVHDLHRPLSLPSSDSSMTYERRGFPLIKLELFTFDDPEGRDTYWHSSAHMLGEALELEYGADLTIGPALEEGFYYDCYLGDRSLGENDKNAIKKRMEQVSKEKQEFQRIVVSKEEALDMFKENKFKMEILGELNSGDTISVYRCGPMVDLCTGPHVPHTGLVKAVDVTAMSRSFWRANTNREPLMRVYGITFPEKKQLNDYRYRIEEAKLRDHRNVGVKQELFFFSTLSPGSCFFYPAGARVYSKLIEAIREKYWEYEYEEVMSPNVYNMDLWETSGHAQHYASNMFQFEVEGSTYALKPMNCPGHCVMFGHRSRSFRELPIRWADFGVLHRNEASGALAGLTRVRRFQQDDAHIFCRPEQMEQELKSFLHMLDDVYSDFGLQYEMALSTKPDDAMGDQSLWDEAENALTNALNSSERKWKLNPGDGAFYGPKIDISVFDALRRRFQCATVQLDFQLPIRFDLQYQDGDETMKRPVIIHRAILGSAERMLAILTEHFGGKWPLWLSPRQVMVVPVSDQVHEYAQEVRRVMRKKRLHVDIDKSSKTMQKKVRGAQLAQYNYILVVGKDEQAQLSVNVRTRDNVVHGQVPMERAAELIAREDAEKALSSTFSMANGDATSSGSKAVVADNTSDTTDANGDL